MTMHDTIEFSDISGPPLPLPEHEETGTGLHRAIAYGLAIGGLLLATIASFGVLLLLLPIGLLVDFFNRRRVEAAMHGSSLRVGPDQLPELYQCAEVLAGRMGLAQVPDIYIVESNVINAAAMRIGSRKVVVLVDDVVDACLRTGNHDALAFLMAHELAHHAHGHTSMLGTWCAAAYKKLSRLNEFTCDTTAAAAVGKDAGFAALAVLLTGPQLLPLINREGVVRQAMEVEQNKHSMKAERAMTHPLLLRRIARFC
jgi:Zn-dependent protease with chaperone function